jgi:hypothetical protein
MPCPDLGTRPGSSSSSSSCLCPFSFSMSLKALWHALLLHWRYLRPSARLLPPPPTCRPLPSLFYFPPPPVTFTGSCTFSPDRGFFPLFTPSSLCFVLGSCLCLMVSSLATFYPSQDQVQLLSVCFISETISTAACCSCLRDSQVSFCFRNYLLCSTFLRACCGL